jgi:uncharacterized SAM-binding protein YcdF (DUF218 family)
MYLTYKLLQLVLRPELWIFACLLVAWALGRSPRRHRSARRLLLVGLLLFYVLGIAPTGQVLLRWLESLYPAPAVAGKSFDAVVVMSGGNVPDMETGQATIIGTDSINRVICGMRIVRKTGTRTLVLTGGVGDPFSRIPPDAEAMRDFAIEFGIPPSSIVTEVDSRHTAASAAEVRRMLPEAHRIVVVTAASHLPRSVALFRKQGFEVTPAPCSYFATTLRWSPIDFLPSAGGLELVNLAIHEYVGIAAYWLLGRL